MTIELIEGYCLRILIMPYIFNMMIWIFFYNGHVEHKLNFVLYLNV